MDWSKRNPKHLITSKIINPAFINRQSPTSKINTHVIINCQSNPSKINTHVIVNSQSNKILCLKIPSPYLYASARPLGPHLTPPHIKPQPPKSDHQYHRENNQIAQGDLSGHQIRRLAAKPAGLSTFQTGIDPAAHNRL